MQCSHCETVCYCCHGHGALHHTSHGCYPVMVHHAGGERCLVTTRDVSQGELLYVEHPLVVGPNHAGDPVCLTCHTPVDGSTECGKCGYPVCSEECAQGEEHRQECGVLRNIRLDREAYNYHIVLPLRLLLSQSVTAVSSLTKLLVDHEEHRRKSDYWEVAENNIVSLLCTNSADHGWSRKEVRRAVGVLEVNAYEIESYGNSGIRGLFPLSSLLNHGCIDNCTMVMMTKFPYTNTVLAARNLKAGEEILSLQGSSDRLHFRLGGK